ncbi:metal dependent phosphohydrolase [Ferrimonas balearica DSM 9799]|uniref:Metal dependent phosphohydrolase n=1 Tax=Ferrimonas balearica (strain DSM 9799 / CCM 4581 / KCTC 23876 / PAT) TaxID=550540 RepID=E1SVL6_FERBD|nr:DUF3391 domain-containing protein [Ferrimonas balearica]ADN76347.1 metal dependent phosphohydrolase [Ferrimonas balearica DSM 9799]
MSQASTKLDIDKVRVGHFVRLPIGWRDHPFMFNSFRIKEPQQIALLKRLKLTFVYIDPDRSRVAADEPAAPAVPDEDTLIQVQQSLAEAKQARIERLKSYQRSLNHATKKYRDNLARARSLSSKVRARPAEGVQAATEVVQGIIAELVNSDGLELHLMSEGEHSDAIHHHGLNVTVLSLMLAKRLGLTEMEMEVVGLGALFHDFGKLRLPAGLATRMPNDAKEWAVFKNHPNMADALIDGDNGLPWQAVAIIRQHHEFLDGSGYPEGLKADRIDPLAQLVTVVNEYDNLVHHKDPRKRRTPNTALGWLYKHRQDQLNTHYLQQFIKMMGIYPPGSIVQLDSGQYGIVMSLDEQNLLSPNVMLYDPAIPMNSAAVISVGEEGLKVAKCLPPEALSKAAFEYLSPRDRINYYIKGQN